MEAAGESWKVAVASGVRGAMQAASVFEGPPENLAMTGGNVMIAFPRRNP